jgi:hypothetical protein
MLARLGELTDITVVDTVEGDRATDAARVDAVGLLERIQAAAAATQAAMSVRFGRSQVTTQQRQVLRDPEAVGRGIADQLALACHVSPSEGSRRLGIARVLHTDLPATAALLRAGRISFYVAGLVVSETRHLDPARRRAVDAQLAAGLPGCAPRQAAALARKLAYAADPAGFVARGRTARTDRRVSVRPAPDTMSLLTGYLPVEQGVACWAALRAHTDTLKNAGDARTRDQIMADTLIERLTGQARAADVQAEVAIVLPVEALIDPTSPAPGTFGLGSTGLGSTGLGGLGTPGLGGLGTPGQGTSGPGCGALPATESGSTSGDVPDAVSGSVLVAEVLGYGPLPAPLAREILAESSGRRWWRRLFTAPHGGIVGGDPTRRCFDRTLATLIGYRDGGRCREPFCDAPARQIEHIVAFRNGGPTTFTNGRATCVRSNQAREMPGWQVRLVHDGRGAHPHTVLTVTPTGHTYTSRAGPAP